jgi:hypothetical protein
MNWRILIMEFYQLFAMAVGILIVAGPLILFALWCLVCVMGYNLLVRALDVKPIGSHEVSDVEKGISNKLLRVRDSEIHQ